MKNIKKLFCESTLQVEDTDKWWQDEELMKNEIKNNIANITPAKIGGSSEKYMVKTKNGHAYLFKPGTEARDLPPLADEVGSRVSAKLRDKGSYIPVFRTTLKVNGDIRNGSIQPIIPDFLQKDYRHPDESLSDLSEEDIIELSKEQVIDWLISNHDAHGNQFIRKDGRIIGIDKSQALKHFGTDVLGTLNDRFYHPNGENGEDYPIYKYIRDALKNKKFNIDQSKVTDAVASVLEKVDALSDDEFVGYFVDYFDALRRSKLRQGENPKKVDDDITNLKDILLRRKKNLRKDFSDYYKKIYGGFEGFGFNS